ncbi:MAG TPA: hypothetical protein VLA46_09535, partial [Saprospiraceae bacterium]|nr:hypothetical protein [Saprospiraceae bacterium]
QQNVVVTDTIKQSDAKKDKNLLKLYVLANDGDTLRYISQKLKDGWNRIGWDMRQKGVRYPSRHEPAKDADDPSGQYVLPGLYKLVGIYGGQRDSVTVNVRLDPRLNITAADLAARNAMLVEFNNEVSRAQVAFQALQDVRKDVKMIETMTINAPDSTQTKLKEKTKELLKQVDELEKGFMEPDGLKGIRRETDNLNRYLGATGAYLNSSLGAPGANAKEIFSQTQQEVERNVLAVNTFLTGPWAVYKTFIEGLEWPLFKTIEMPK